MTDSVYFEIQTDNVRHDVTRVLYKIMITLCCLCQLKMNSLTVFSLAILLSFGQVQSDDALQVEPSTTAGGKSELEERQLGIVGGLGGLGLVGLLSGLVGAVLNIVFSLLGGQLLGLPFGLLGGELLGGGLLGGLPLLGGLLGGSLRNTDEPPRMSAAMNSIVAAAQQDRGHRAGARRHANVVKRRLQRD